MVEFLFWPLSNQNKYKISWKFKMASRGECSSLISVKQFKEQFLEFLAPTQYERKKVELEPTDMAKEMNVAMEIVTDLSEVCR